MTPTPPPGAPALEARALVAGHAGREVLHGCDLRLDQGRRVTLLGANGSGKTTLLRCLSGAHRPSSGQVLAGGNPLDHSRRGLRAHRRAVQLVLQDPDDQLFSVDVRADVSFGPLNLGLDATQVRERVDEALALLAVEHLADRPTHQLSYGERKRVATAGAVAMRPSMLLLDEPTAGLDPAGVHEMLAALERLLTQGTTVLLATHDVDLALAWGDEAAVVVDGMVCQGPVTALLDDADLLARARLHRPWPLELAARLGLAARPRHLDEVLAALAADRQPTPPTTHGTMDSHSSKEER